LNKSFAKVAKIQGKEIWKCIKDGASERLVDQTVEACAIADNRGKVEKAKRHTILREIVRCPTWDIPDFAHTSGDEVNHAAVHKELDLVHEIFGSDLSAAIKPASSHPALSKCQVAVAKALSKCRNAKLKAFNDCKKNGLKGKKAPPEASLPFDDRSDVALCMGQDPRGRVSEVCETKLADKINRVCQVGDISIAFPGCSGTDHNQLGTCLDRLVRCQVCLGLNAADDLTTDCDGFDDEAVNQSCP
jgi:hypothetical protein